jgi:hypothetical protein
MGHFSLLICYEWDLTFHAGIFTFFQRIVSVFIASAATVVELFALSEVSVIPESEIKIGFTSVE